MGGDGEKGTGRVNIAYCPSTKPHEVRHWYLNAFIRPMHCPRRLNSLPCPSYLSYMVARKSARVTSCTQITNAHAAIHHKTSSLRGGQFSERRLFSVNDFI